jgi:hypothetical protein
VGNIVLKIPSGIRESDRVECKLTITSLDTIKLEARDYRGDHIEATFDLSQA